MKKLIVIILLLSLLSTYIIAIPALAVSTNGITTSMMDDIFSQYGYIDRKTYWVYNEKKDKASHPNLPDDWYQGSTDSSYVTSNQIGSGKTLSYRVGSLYECAGFASFVGWKLTGSKPKTSDINSTSGLGSGWKSYTSSQIASSGGVQPGDIIRTSTHSAVVYSVNSNGSFTVAEVWGGTKNEISIGHGFNANGSSTNLNSISGIKYILRYDNIVNPFLVFSSTGTSSNGFYRIIKGAGNLFEYPYSDSTVKGTVRTNIDISSLTANDVVEVVETVNNSLGNSWAKLRNGYFISMDNLEYLYTKEANVNLTATNTQKDLQTLPFADAIVGSTMSGNSMQVNLVEKYRNKYNNIWYKISSDQGGYFININNLSNITNNVTLTLKRGSTWPGDKNSATGYPRGELEQGKGFGLRGVIESNENITKVVGSITNLSTGANVSVAGSPQIVSPNAQTINIKDSNINNNLLFDKLDNGNYRFTVTATTASGYSKALIDEAFTVGSSTIPTLKVENIDIWYWGENVINGTILEYDDSDIGYQCSISAAVSPDSASNNITWSNSNSNVVTLDAANYNFVVKGFGTTTITVSSTDGSNITESITVEVTCRHLSSTWETIQEPTYTSAGRRIRKCSICNETIATEDIPVLAPINVTSVTLSTHAVTLAPNQTYQLFVTVLPTNTTYQNCRWQSSNPDVATVSSNGLVTAISAGSTNIICRSEKDDGTLDIAIITVEPSHGACGDDLTWRFENPTLSIRGTGVMYNYALGSAPWYSYSDRITTITLGNGVETIGEGAFYNMTHVSQVNLPPSLISIGNAAFDRCTSLTNINLPESLKTIGLLAFDQSGLTSVMLPNGLETLGDSAFQDCQQLQQVSIPYTLSAIPAYAFLRCNNLATIDVPVSIYKIGLGAFYDCSNLESIYLPDNITIIENDAFHGVPQNAEIHAYRKSYAAQYAKDNHFALVYSDSVMNAPDLWLPASLTEIGEEAFAGNPAEWIKLSAKVTTIGPRAFADCMNLTEIYIPETATSISATAFEGVPAGLTIYTKSGSYAEFYATNNGYNVHIVPSKTAAQ